MAISKIEWTDYTFNPWVGCQKISPGCDHCYAEARSIRFNEHLWGAGVPRRRTLPANWAQVEKWNSNAIRFYDENGRFPLVFCGSLCDFADNAVPPSWQSDLAATIERAPYLTWLLLTKRPENISKRFPWGAATVDNWPPNVWLGVSVENQARFDHCVTRALDLSPRIFLSVEPLLEGIKCRTIDVSNDLEIAPFGWNCLDRLEDGESDDRRVSWVIVGGESGADARPMHLKWARDIRDDCRHAGIAYFFKQSGAWRSLTAAEILNHWRPGDLAPPAWRSLDGDGNLSTLGIRREIPVDEMIVIKTNTKNDDLGSIPADLRIREFPDFGDDKRASECRLI